jgi:hypothetical protein
VLEAMTLAAPRQHTALASRATTVPLLRAEGACPAQIGGRRVSAACSGGELAASSRWGRSARGNRRMPAAPAPRIAAKFRWTDDLLSDGSAGGAQRAAGEPGNTFRNFLRAQARLAAFAHRLATHDGRGNTPRPERL